MRPGRKRKLGIRTPYGRHRRLSSKPDADAIFSKARALYVVQIGADIVKIGISGHPEARLKDMQSGNAQTLRTAWLGWMENTDAIAVERAIHVCLKHTNNHARGECYYMSTDAAVSLARRTIEGLGIKCLTDDLVREHVRLEAAS